MKTSEKTWLSESEAVEYTGFDRNVLSKWRLRGSWKGITLPFYKVSEKNIRYKRKEIDEFIEAHQASS